MTARFLVGDVHERLQEIPDQSIDFLVTSPPFLALRSYLPEDHPDKAKEIGSEATPAEFLDVLLQLTGEWGRVLAPHGSIAIELGDTYAGSGGAGGDYGEDGLRDGQQRFNGAAAVARAHAQKTRTRNPGPGWPLAKSLACIPQLYQVALAYGINPLTGQASPAGRWRVRNLKPWIRSNPPVGALGDKERPATSYVIVACRASDRFFDLDAVRTPGVTENGRPRGPKTGGAIEDHRDTLGEYVANAGGAPPRDWWHHVDAILDAELAQRAGKHAGSGGTGDDMECPTCHGEGCGYVRVGPDDWEWQSCGQCRGTGYIPSAIIDQRVDSQQNFSGRRDPHAHGAAAGPDEDDSSRVETNLSSAPNPALIDVVLDAELNARAGKRNGGEVRPGSDVTVVGKLGHDGGDATNNMGHGRYHQGALSVGAQGVHLRRALERAGILQTQEALDVSPKGYAGAHYAVWPPELVRLLINEMCPARVCATCGQPSRRIVGEAEYVSSKTGRAPAVLSFREGERGDKVVGHGIRAPQNVPYGDQGVRRVAPTLGWSDCGHDTWRPGHVFDPFAGSGTTLQVAVGMGRAATGIDIDERNADLALERCGMFLEISDRPIDDEVSA